MPVIIPEASADTFLDSDWNEIVDLSAPGGACVLSPMGSEDTLQILLPANKIRSCARWVLGYSIADTAAPWRLRRPRTPICHPRIPWLWADSIAFQFYNPKGNPLKDSTEFSGFKVPQDDAIQYVGYGPNLVSKYHWALGTIRFREVGWGIYPESDPAWNNTIPEYNRFFGFQELSPKLEIVQAEGAQDAASFRFAETDDPASADGPTAGASDFNGTVYQFATKTGFTLVWKQVEQSYCCSGSFFMPYPKKLLAGLGRANSGPLFGSDQFPIGTALLAGLVGRRYQQPVRTDSTTGLWAWDWYLQFEHTDPPKPAGTKDSAGAAIAAGDQKYGHLLRPWRNSKYWYYATKGANKGLTTGVAALETFDFAKLFDHVLKP